MHISQINPSHYNNYVLTFSASIIKIIQHIIIMVEQKLTKNQFSINDSHGFE